MERKYEELARVFVNAIKEIAQKEDNLDNLEGYLSFHFETWMQKYASTPLGITQELSCFASMDI